MMGPDGFDHFGEDDFDYDEGLPHDLYSSSQVDVAGLEITVASVSMSGTASASASMTGNLSVHRESAEQPEPAALEEPADLLWTPIARLIMSPARYRGEWLQHLSDMNAERHECLERGNLLGAHLAVIRAHFYSLPVSWLLIPVRFVLHLLKQWLGF